MKIDIFNHLFPRRFFDEYINTPSAHKHMGKRVREAATIVDLDARFRVMDDRLVGMLGGAPCSAC